MDNVVRNLVRLMVKLLLSQKAQKREGKVHTWLINPPTSYWILYTVGIRLGTQIIPLYER